MEKSSASGTAQLVSRSLRCAECGRVDDRHERGWTLRLDEDDDPHAFCPDCDQREFGGRC